MYSYELLIKTHKERWDFWSELLLNIEILFEIIRPNLTPNIYICFGALKGNFHASSHSSNIVVHLLSGAYRRSNLTWPLHLKNLNKHQEMKCVQLARQTIAAAKICTMKSHLWRRRVGIYFHEVWSVLEKKFVVLAITVKKYFTD